MTRGESRALVQTLRKATSAARRDLLVYISMAFGNPYDEPWGPEIVEETLEWLKSLNVRTVSLADTVGTATPEEVGKLYAAVKGSFPAIDLAALLHTPPAPAPEQVPAA